MDNFVLGPLLKTTLNFGLQMEFGACIEQEDGKKREK